MKTTSLMGVLGLAAVLACGAVAQDVAKEKPAKPQKETGPAIPAGAENIVPLPKDPYEKEGKKLVYVGPKDLITLPPTPMLDEEAKQRLDPDGKPMFNPAVKQARDKHGNPEWDEHRKPVFQTKDDLGYDEKGHKIHAKKEKEPKKTPLTISRGTFTVDGVVGKAGMNYEIADLKFLYLYAPGIGTTIVSSQPFPGATMQKNAFSEKTLTVTVGEHTLQLASDNRMLGKKPEAAYVAVNRDFLLPSKFPVVGYGGTTKAPYQWPGSKDNKQLAGIITPPPIPKNLKPVALLAPCPKGMMRKNAGPVLPGDPVVESPCVAINDTAATPSPSLIWTGQSGAAKPAEAKVSAPAVQAPAAQTTAPQTTTDAEPHNK